VEAKSNMIRALTFCDIINPYDYIDNVITRFDQSKIDLHALTGMGAPPIGGYKVGEKYETQFLGYMFERRNYRKMFLALMAKIRAFRPHVIHAHGFDANLIASLAVKAARRPCYVLGRHYSDHIYILTRGLKRKAYLAAEGFCNRTATRIVAPTEEVAGILTGRQGVPREKVAIIPYGLDFNKYRVSSPSAPSRLRSEFGLEGKYLALGCARLSVEKGLEYLLRAIPRVRRANEDFRLVIAGVGPLEAELRKLCRDLGLDDVAQFLGWRKDVMDWFAAADLIAHPALAECWPQALAEALAFTKPVVMTRIATGPELIGNNERGRLVPPRDSEAIADAIIELMNNRELSRALAESGRDYLYRNTSADHVARRYEELYFTALSRRAA
jgi:glycosyltransferase involved in cell wall biosynthesis